MRTFTEFLERIREYHPLEYIYDPSLGYLAWRLGTGDNLEFLFIEVAEKRKHYGTELYRQMVKRLEESGRRPYYSVFGFVLGGNDGARTFYSALGFQEVNLGRSVYKNDDTVLVWIPYEKLKKI